MPRIWDMGIAGKKTLVLKRCKDPNEIDFVYPKKFWWKFMRKQFKYPLFKIAYFKASNVDPVTITLFSHCHSQSQSDLQ